MLSRFFQGVFMSPTPYPARRRYPWALLHIVMDYTNTVRFFKKMQRQCPQDKNPARHATFALMLECIDELNHKGVEEFAGDKLHRLLIKCADRCGWHTDANKIQRSLVPRLVEGTKDIYTCPKCGEDKPRADFMGLMTGAQRERYNKPEGTRALIMQKRCNNCRYNANEAKRRKEKRVSERRAVRQWAKLTTNKKAIGGQDIYQRYCAELDRQLHNTKVALRKVNKINPATTRAAFYQRKVELIRLCAERLDEHLDNAMVAKLETGVVWTNLITHEEYAELEELRIIMTRDSDTQGRRPSIL